MVFFCLVKVHLKRIPGRPHADPAALANPLRQRLGLARPGYVCGPEVLSSKGTPPASRCSFNNAEDAIAYISQLPRIIRRDHERLGQQLSAQHSKASLEASSFPRHLPEISLVS